MLQARSSTTSAARAPSNLSSDPTGKSQANSKKKTILVVESELYNIYIFYVNRITSF